VPVVNGEVEHLREALQRLVDLGLEYFSLSVASKGSNWFGVDREVLGEVVYKCGEPGNAGCPASGEWG
jgi:hypothetical protein